MAGLKKEARAARAAASAKLREDHDKELVTVMWRRDREFIRAWRAIWIGDFFEVMSQEEWEAHRKVLSRFGFRVVEADD